MLLKDTLNLIKQTYKRFFTIVAIVLIGVSFMMGLTSTSTIMRKSVDRYNHNLYLQDYQLISNYGFCEEDINELKGLDFIDKVYASKQIDAYCLLSNGDVLVSRIRELNSLLNRFELIEGRLPENDNEVLLVSPKLENIKIGDRLITYLNGEDLQDSLKETNFIVTGIGKSSDYMSKFLSTSNLDNLDLDIVIYAKNDIFIGEYNTNVAFTIKGSDKYLTTSEEYFNFIKQYKDRIELFKDSQQTYNKNKIVTEAKQEIEDAKIELEDKRKDGQEELDDALKELNDAWKEIIDGQNEIDDGIKKLEDAQIELDDGKKELEANERKINDAKNQVVEKAGGGTFDDIYNQTKLGVDSYNELVTAKNSLQDSYDQIMSLFPGGITQIDAVISMLNPISDAEKISQLQQSIFIINQYNEIINNLNTYYPGDTGSILIETLKQLDQLKEGERQIAEGKNKLADAQYTIDTGWIDIEDAKNKLADGKKKYYDGKQDYEDGLKEFNDKIADAEKEIKDAEDELNDMKDAKWYILDRDSHYSSYMYKNTCSQMGAIGIVMPFLFFLVAALVCMTTMTRLVDEQRGQNGIYSALGYSNNYIISKYLLYVFIASMLGSIPGIFIGMAIFPTVIYKTWRLLYDLPEMIKLMPAITLIISIASFAILMMIVTYFVLKSSLNEKPAQLMRPKAPKSSKGILLEKIKFIWNRLSFTSKITARNLIRYKARFFMTIIGVAGCTGLLVLGWGVKDSISDVVNVQYGTIFNYDYTVNLENDDDIDEIICSLNNDDNNEEVSPYMSYTTKATFENDDSATISAIVLTPDNMNKSYKLRDYKNNKLLQLDDNGVIITEKYAINNNLKVGDIISIESREGKTAKVEIKAISKMYFQHYMYLSENLYKKIFDEDIHYTNIAIENSNELNTILKSINKYENINSITDFTSFTNQFNVMIEALDLIILVIILTAGALAFVVLINLIQVNISERTREIATFKVLGFRNTEVDSYIFKEIIILTLIGAIIGLPLGKIEEKFVMNVINMEMIMFPNNIKPLSYLYAFVITMIFTIIVLILSKKPIKKINMIESLKSVE